MKRNKFNCVGLKKLSRAYRLLGVNERGMLLTFITKGYIKKNHAIENFILGMNHKEATKPENMRTLPLEYNHITIDGDDLHIEMERK